MTKPQQPELRRSGKGDTDQDGKELRAEDELDSGRSRLGPVPEENKPGHHPEDDEDKPPPADG